MIISGWFKIGEPPRKINLSYLKSRKCDYCDEMFTNMKKYARHKRIDHKDKKEFPCGGCDLGMISHKKSLITNFGHKHFRQKFCMKFDIFLSLKN